MTRKVAYCYEESVYKKYTIQYTKHARNMLEQRKMKNIDSAHKNPLP